MIRICHFWNYESYLLSILLLVQVPCEEILGTTQLECTIVGFSMAVLIESVFSHVLQAMYTIPKYNVHLYFVRTSSLME